MLALRHGMALGWALHHLGRLERGRRRAGQPPSAAADGDGTPPPITPTRSTASASCGSRWEATRPRSRCSTRRCACGRADRTSDALRVRILNTRAKIRRRQKDFTAAAEDVQQALELARALDDDRVLAETVPRRLARRGAPERVHPRARVRRAVEGALRARLRPRVRRQAPEQPRPAARDHRPARRGGAAPARVVPDRGRAGQPDRRGLRGLVAGLGAPALG